MTASVKPALPLSRDILRSRAREAVGYLRFIAMMVDGPAPQGLKVSISLKSTLKANLCLLAYSAVEATMWKLLEELREAIAKEALGSDDLCDALALMAVKHLHGKASEDDLKALTHFYPAQQRLSALLFDAWTKDAGLGRTARTIKPWSRNIDSRAIIKTLRDFGVLSADEEAPHLKQEALQRFKNRRNDLAHGDRSFTDVGHELTVSELARETRITFRVLAQTVQTAAIYLAERRYLRAAPSPARAL